MKIGGKIKIEGRLSAVREVVSKKTGITNHYGQILFEGGAVQLKVPMAIQGLVGKRIEAVASYDVQISQVWGRPTTVFVPDEVLEYKEIKG